MKIKKFEATTEQAAIELVKEEFGLEALVLSIKKTQPKGLKALFKKPVVEVTAAFDESKADKRGDETKKEVQNTDSFKEAKSAFEVVFDKTEFANNRSLPQNQAQAVIDKLDAHNVKDKTISEQKRKIAALEEMLLSKDDLIKRVEKQLTVSSYRIAEGNKKYKNNIIQVFFDTLIGQGVKEDVAEFILEDLNFLDENDKIDINLLVKIVYNNVVNIIGDSETLEINKAEKGRPRIVAFIGSTGVGKTTTVAKLSADFILNRNLNVGLLTADTYRIAAVEQLKTYADILGVEIGVVYNSQDLAEYVDLMSSINDVLFIDTAGRSHKNKENLYELKQLLDSTPNCEKFLVLSLATKYEDMLDIVMTYSEITDFKIIFTKLDETLSFGSVLNLCHDTGKKISYITFGQNVPDDIRPLTAAEVAKAILCRAELVS